MATFQQRLEALKAKSARLRQSKLEKLKEKTSELKKAALEAGSRVSIKVSTAARDASRRVSVSASRASRHFSVSRKSFYLENGGRSRDGIENSSSTQDGEFAKEIRFEDESNQLEGDNVRNASDNEEEKEEELPKKEEKPEKEEKEIPESAHRKSTITELPKIPKHRPALESKNWDPKTATAARLHQALLAGKWEEAVWCINKGADIRKWKGILGETTLHEACMRRAPSPVIRALINAGADVNKTTMMGLSALHSACLYNPSKTVIEVIIKAGARVNLQSKNGMTPLTAAAMQGRAIEVLALLMRYGANPRIIGSNYKTAIDCAKNDKIANFLRNAPNMQAFLLQKPQKFPKDVLIRIKSYLY